MSDMQPKKTWFLKLVLALAGLLAGAIALFAVNRKKSDSQSPTPYLVDPVDPKKLQVYDKDKKTMEPVVLPPEADAKKIESVDVAPVQKDVKVEVKNEVKNRRNVAPLADGQSPLDNLRSGK